MNWQNLLILMILLILFLIIIEITRLNTYKKCPKPIIEYRYIPRTFKDEQEEPISIEDIFGIMFSKPSPWMISRGINNTGRQHLINTSFTNREFKIDGKTFGKRSKL
jgi:hypothetical protein